MQALLGSLSICEESAKDPRSNRGGAVDIDSSNNGRLCVTLEISSQGSDREDLFIINWTDVNVGLWFPSTT